MIRDIDFLSSTRFERLVGDPSLAVVSITDPGSSDARIPSGFGPSLRLKFDDLDDANLTGCHQCPQVCCVSNTSVVDQDLTDVLAGHELLPQGTKEVFADGLVHDLDDLGVARPDAGDALHKAFHGRTDLAHSYPGAQAFCRITYFSTRFQNVA